MSFLSGHISLAFGPVRSRRLGWSLGVNNIPRKNCSYDCIYCQVGRTSRKIVDRQAFYPVNLIVRDVEQKIREAEEEGLRIDYISFVPDGEPTLDINLGHEIRALRRYGYPIAVFTNSSLLWRVDVREDLYDSDLVSVKVDAVSYEVWRQVNQPHRELDLDTILSGIEDFARSYNGTLITETMLVDRIDYSDEIKELAKFIQRLNPRKAYIMVPIRPSAVEGVGPASEETLLAAYHEYAYRLGKERVELLAAYPEIDAYELTSPEKEILEITSVHAMRLSEVERLLEEKGFPLDIIGSLSNKGLIRVVEYRGLKFIVRTR